jgi:hypothetical protein
VHALNAHRIHRTISGLKEFDPMGFRPRVRAVSPAGSAYALAASHEAMFARPNVAARWPLKDVCEHPGCAHQGHTLDYLQGQGRQLRPPRDVSFRIHPSLGHWVEPTRPCEAYPQSRVLAGCLPPDGGHSFSIQRPRHAATPLVPAPSPRWVQLRPRSTACGLPLRPTRTRPARLRIATFWHDNSVAGPAQASVRSMWGLLAPASFDSDTASPAPDQPRSGMIAQSWVRLRTKSAAFESLTS